MHDQPIVLLPQMRDNRGRTIYAMHAFDGSQRTPGTIAQNTPVMGMLRFDMSDESSITAEFPGGFPLRTADEDSTSDWEEEDDSYED